MHPADSDRNTAEQRDARSDSPADMVLCQSADGWSFHAPGSTDEQIASGDARYVLAGPGEPTDADRYRAYRIWLDRQG